MSQKTPAGVILALTRLQGSAEHRRGLRDRALSGVSCAQRVQPGEVMDRGELTNDFSGGPARQGAWLAPGRPPSGRVQALPSGGAPAPGRLVSA